MRHRFALLFLVACSSSEKDAGAPRQCLAPPAAIDSTMPEVSFKTTIAPMLQQNCALPACHGDPKSSLGIYLSGDAAQMYGALKKPAVTNLKFDFVKPGAPNESFMMHKVDGTQCSLDKDCVKDTCGNVMPPDAPLAVADRDAIRRWIAQGAKDN